MDYNPFLPEIQENPYPHYAYLRRHAPVYHIASLGWWAVARYDDVLSITKNPGVFSSYDQMATFLGEELNFCPGALNAIDPPAHTRLRKLVNKAFTPRMVPVSRRGFVPWLISSLPASPLRGNVISSPSSPARFR